MNLSQQAPRLPLRDLAKEISGLPRCVNGLEVFNAFIYVFGEQPERGEAGLRVYSRQQLELILATSCIESGGLLELEEWRKLVPLSGCATRKDAMTKLAKIGSEGWLQRCSYKRGCLLLCREDAERLCYTRRTGHFALPLRWKIPVVLTPDTQPCS
jgi:hypothetical protein